MLRGLFVLFLISICGLAQAQLDITTVIPPGAPGVIIDMPGTVPGSGERMLIIPAGEQATELIEKAPEIAQAAQRNNLSFSMNFLTTEDYAKEMAQEKELSKLHRWNVVLVIKRIGLTGQVYLMGFSDVPELNKIAALMFLSRSALLWAKPGRWMQFQEWVDHRQFVQKGMNWAIKRGIDEAWVHFASRAATNIAVSTFMFNVTQSLMRTHQDYWATLAFSILPNATVGAAANLYTRMPGVKFLGKRELMNPRQSFYFSAGWNLSMAALAPRVMEGNAYAMYTVGVLGVIGGIAFFWAPEMLDLSKSITSLPVRFVQRKVIPLSGTTSEFITNWYLEATEKILNPIWEPVRNLHARTLSSSSKNMCALSLN